MRTNKFELKSILLTLALGVGLAAPAAAAGLTYRMGKVTAMGVLTNFTTATKVVNGKTVYVEGVPLLTMNLNVNGTTHYYQFPYSGDKAKAWLDMFTEAKTVGATLTVHHSETFPSPGRYQCGNYLEEGCIEILGPIRGPLIQWVTVNL